MTTLTLLLGLALGASLMWWACRERAGQATAERDWLRKELTTAQERLLYAVREDRAIVPPRPAEMKAHEPLPPTLQEEVNAWESPETQREVEASLRDLHFERGLSPRDALLRLQEQREERRFGG